MGAQFFPSSHHTMIKLCVLSLSLLCVSAAPSPDFMDYLEYLPPSLKDFVEDTLEDGTEVLGNIQEDVEKEIIGKTSENFESISEKMEKVLADLNDLKEKNDEIWEDYDISEADKQELSEKLEEIKKDISEDDEISDDVEKMIQQHINTFRAFMLNMTEDWRGWHKNFYNSSE